MARNSNELICSGVPFQAHPEITFQVFPNNMTSSPLMLTRLQSFPTKLVCDMGAVPRMGRKGKRTNLVCRKSELWGSTDPQWPVAAFDGKARGEQGVALRAMLQPELPRNYQSTSIVGQYIQCLCAKILACNGSYTQGGTPS